MKFSLLKTFRFTQSDENFLHEIFFTIYGEYMACLIWTKTVTQKFLIQKFCGRNSCESRYMYIYLSQYTVYSILYFKLMILIFARSDAAATIYFIAQFCAASIWERRLIESSVYWYQWTWLSSPDHSHLFNVHGRSGYREKSDQGIEEDKDRLEENEFLLDTANHIWASQATPYSQYYYITIDITPFTTVLLLCAHATRIVAMASIREWPLFLSAHLEVRLLLESSD